MFGALLLACVAPSPVDLGARFSERGLELGDGVVIGTARADATRVVDGGEVRYEHPALVEWWRPLRSGYEQGWTVHAPQATIVLDVPIAGATTEDTVGAVWVRSATRTYRYAALHAWDAAREPLDAQLRATPAGIRITVDARGARFPITVDPIVTVASETITPSPSVSYGYAVAVGDANGDGYDDLAVGSDQASTVYVYQGTARGLTYLAGMNGSNDTFGAALDFRGDVNADGYADLVVGNPVESGAGEVTVWQGNASSLSLSTTLSTTGGGAEYGSAVSTGDADGDGYDDVAIGSPSYVGAEGHVWLHAGSASGVGTARFADLDAPATPSGFGSVVDAGGDFDDDGYADTLATAPLYEGTTEAGYVAIVSGGAIPWSVSDFRVGELDAGFSQGAANVGDTNGDGYDDVLVGCGGVAEARWYGGSASGLAASPAVTLTEAVTDGYAEKIAAAGDIDADGYDDILLARPGDDVSAGQVWVYSGGSGGPVTTAIWSLSGASGTGLGGALAAGDMNGDGYGDVIVGAPGDSSAYVYYGYADADGDGSWATEDCDDTDADRYPSAAEVCDEVDNDCDSLVDEGVTVTSYPDDDGDGYGDAAGAVTGCGTPTDHVDNGEDCDDTDGAVHPGARETAGDGADGNCDGIEACYVDADHDGARTDATTETADIHCAEPGLAGADAPVDCDDTDPAISPTATEVVGDGIDQDCDGVEACYTDADADGYRTTEPIPGNDLDCADADEVPESTPASDCDDDDPTVSPGAGEIVGDEVDGDCDGTELCLIDADGDDWRALGLEVVTSDDPDCADLGEAAGTTPGGDCDDTDVSVHPEAPDPPDGIDQDCDGVDGDGPGDTAPLGGKDPQCGCASPGGYPGLAAILAALSLLRARSRAGRAAPPRRPPPPSR